MKKQLSKPGLRIVTLFFFLFLFSCQRSNDLSPAGDVYNSAAMKKASNNIIAGDPPPTIEDTLSESLVNAMNNSSPTLGDLFHGNRNDPDYISLQNSSIAILQYGGILDSLKFYLNITDNSDPRLILAAKLINDLTLVPVPGNPGSFGSSLLKCGLEAIGIPSSLIIGKIGTAFTLSDLTFMIKNMGLKVFAKVVSRVALKALNWAGWAIMAAQFTWCMVFAEVSPSTEGLPSGGEYIPNMFFDPDRIYFDQVKESIVDYLLDQYGVNTTNALDIIENAYLSKTGQPDTLAIRYVASYFQNYDYSIVWPNDNNDNFLQMTFTVVDFNSYITSVVNWTNNPAPHPVVWEANDIVYTINQYHGSMEESQDIFASSLGNESGFITQLIYYVNHYYFNNGSAAVDGTPGPYSGDPDTIPGPENSNGEEPVPPL